ncbi:helix-turn-helix domain-containing protein [Streptomyces zhaozhouensis]|nr:helix-turn-helix transcriptional regulator [Streptomyces zhaozhouensis]
MRATGETQRDLAAGIGLAQSQVSKRQSGITAWDLAEVDAVSRHYGIPVPDLFAGVEHAVHKLPAHRRAVTIGGTQTALTVQGRTAGAAMRRAALAVGSQGLVKLS